MQKKFFQHFSIRNHAIPYFLMKKIFQEILWIHFDNHACAVLLHCNFIQISFGQIKKNGILLPKLFWPTVRNNVLVIKKNF